jgi:hypothetical protein
MRYCFISTSSTAILWQVARSDRLAVALGKKIDQPLNRTYRVEFVYGVAASRPDYVDIALYARKGPLGTGNYRIALEAVGLENDQTFIHLEYSYTFGFIGRLAMKIYLAGGGRGKVGFSTIGDPDDPEPQFIEGSRAALERNAVRYYLAIDAYLGSLVGARSGSLRGQPGALVQRHRTLSAAALRS